MTRPFTSECFGSIDQNIYNYAYNKTWTLLAEWAKPEGEGK